MNPKIKSTISKVDIDSDEEILMFWVEDEEGRELFGPTENPKACEDFITESE